MVKRWGLLPVFFVLAAAWGQDIKDIKGPEPVPGYEGLVRWYRVQQEKPWFFRELETLFNVVTGTQPFGRSVALLVGVSQYEHLPTQLPSVRNDLKQMREFLLDRGGFDEVLLVQDQAVNRDLLEKIFQKLLPERLKREDRLLFYYSGHGDDNAGHTGFLQFGKARPGDFFGPQVLEVKTVHRWMREVEARHQLYLLDSCASGMAIAGKAGGENCDTAILNALQGKGSRAVISAGTSDQKVYAQGRDEAGNGVLTHAFLDAFATTRAGQSCNMLTVHEVFGHIQKRVAAFKVAADRNVTPDFWDSSEAAFEGTFVFLSGRTGNPKLTEAQRSALGVVEKSGEQVGFFGWILVISPQTGTVYIDGRPYGSIELGEGKRYLLSEGSHRVEVRGGGQTLSQSVTVNRAQETTLSLRLPIPDADFRPKHGEKRSFRVTDEISIDMIWLEPGTFMMGSPESEPGRFDGETLHRVTLTQGFWLGETEVSQALWTAIMGNNPSRFQGPDRPVEKVSWEDCVAFIQKANAMAPGLNLRLPTEAEWEYACRAGTSTPFSFGKTISTDQVNYDGNYPNDGSPKGNYGGETVSVESLPANPWGLHAMHGNVWEWCADWDGADPTGAVVDPVGPPEGLDRVVRGGSWSSYGRSVRSAYRLGAPPEDRNSDLGFRLARGRNGPGGQE